MSGSRWRDPVTLDGLFARPEPQPDPDCPACVEFARARNAARNGGDVSRVSDLNVVMRKHLAKGHC